MEAVELEVFLQRALEVCQGMGLPSPWLGGRSVWDDVYHWVGEQPERLEDEHRQLEIHANGETLGYLGFLLGDRSEDDFAHLGYLCDVLAQSLREFSTQQQRRSMHEAYAYVMASTSEAVVALDLQAKIVAMNPAAERLFEVSSEKAIGLPITQFSPPEIGEEQQELLAEARENGSVGTRRTERLTKTGRRVPVELSVSLRTDEKGKAVGYCGMVRDVTEKYRAEEIIRQLHEGTGGTTGERFFHELALRLGALLGASQVLVSVLVSQYRAKTLAVWSSGEMLDNFEYDLLGTPCAEVCTHRQSCVFPSKVQESFPEDQDLVDMQAESYLGAPVFDSQGEVVGMLTVLDNRPMTEVPHRQQVLEVFANRAGAEMERLTTEVALRESESRFRALMEQSPTAMAIFSANGTLQTLNRAWHEAAGLGAEVLDSLLGKLNLLSIAEPQLHGFGVQVRSAFLGEPSALPEHEFDLDGVLAWLGLPASGRGARWLKCEFYPLKDDHGSVLSVVLSVKDVTSQRLADQRAHQLSERLSLALRAGEFGVWDWDVEEDSLLWDERMYEIYGVKEGDFGGAYEAWRAGVHPEDLAKSECEVQEALEGKRSFQTEFRIITPEGEVRHLQALGVVLRSADGQPIRMIGMNSDITEKTRAAEVRAELESQLNQAQRMESIGRLAGGVAHDFNNMLSVIIGNVDLALMELESLGPEHELMEEMKEIEQAAKRSAELTRQLLAFARKQTIMPSSMDLNLTITNTLKMLERLTTEQIRLHWKPGEELWSIMADPSQVDQILMNLCVNACDAITDDGEITIATRNLFTDREYVELRVSDTGQGMDAETRAQVFEPFFTTKEQGKGTGLGMSTVYGIVQQNGGKIRVESCPGQGTEVVILWPRLVGDCSESTPERPRAGGGHETILLVEDQPQVLRVTKRMLENLGYAVYAETSPLAALTFEQGFGQSIDLLLTDVVMPEMDGRQLAEELARRRPGLRCLFMSGYTADIIAARGVLDEGMLFLSKPFSADELALSLRGALSLDS